MQSLPQELRCPITWIPIPSLPGPSLLPLLLLPLPPRVQTWNQTLLPPKAIIRPHMQSGPQHYPQVVGGAHVVLRPALLPPHPHWLQMSCGSSTSLRIAPLADGAPRTSGCPCPAPLRPQALRAAFLSYSRLSMSSSRSKFYRDKVRMPFPATSL